MTAAALVAITEHGHAAYIIVPRETRPLDAIAALISDMTLMFPAARSLTIAAGASMDEALHRARTLARECTHQLWRPTVSGPKCMDCGVIIEPMTVRRLDRAVAASSRSILNGRRDVTAPKHHDAA